MMTKDPNFGIFFDTSGRVSETYQVYWSRIYSIFDNYNLSDIQNDQPTYQRIRDSGIHSIAARPVVLPYNDAVKWIIKHANTKDLSFNSSTGLQLTNFCPEIFTRAYRLKPARQVLDTNFFKVCKSLEEIWGIKWAS